MLNRDYVIPDSNKFIINFLFDPLTEQFSIKTVYIYFPTPILLIENEIDYLKR